TRRSRREHRGRPCSRAEGGARQDLPRCRGRADGAGDLRRLGANADIAASRIDAVGTLITERPPHRTVRAAFPHTAPTSGVSSTWFSSQSDRRNASKGGEAACEGDSGDKTPIRRRSLALLPMRSERPSRRPADRSEKQPLGDKQIKK